MLRAARFGRHGADDPHGRRAASGFAAAVLTWALLASLHAPAARSADEPPVDPELLEALGDVALYVDAEVLVSGAARRVAKLSEAPGTITVIDARQLRERGALTLEEALRLVPSLTFVPGSVGWVTRVRDLEEPFANKVLLLQDGRVLNDVARGSFFVDLTQPLDDVARIEVVRGPGSALYGANAFAGFVNVITRKGDEVAGVEATATAGTSSLAHGSIVAGGVRGQHDWRLTARHASMSRFDPAAPGDDAEESAGSLDFHWGRGSSKGEAWFANVAVADVAADVPGELRFRTPGNRREEERVAADFYREFRTSERTRLKVRTHATSRDGLQVLHRADVVFGALSDQQLNQLGNLAYDSALVRLPVLPGPEEPDDAASCAPCDEVALGVPGGESAAFFQQLVGGALPQAVDRVRGDEWSAFAEVQADWQVSKANYLLGGVSARVDDVDDAAIGRHSFRDKALFVEDEHRFLAGRLLLLGSLRVDDHSFFGVTTSPRVSLIWSPSRKLTMKSAYGRAFRAPNFVELFGDTRVGTAEVLGQRRAVELGRMPDEFVRRTCLDPACTDFREEVLRTELRQESIQTLELLTEVAPTERLRVGLNLYAFEIEDEIGVALDRNDVYVLLDTAATLAVRPSGVDRDGDTIPDVTIPRASLFAVPGLADVATFGVFLNSPEPTRGAGAELEVHARPWDWLDVEGWYGRRRLRQGLVGDFVERDAAAADQQLVPTFGTRRTFVDQAGAAFTFRKGELFWASLRTRFLGRPDDSFLSRGGTFTADVTLGLRAKAWTFSATGLDVAEGGFLYDPERGDFLDGHRDVRLAVTWRRAF